METWWLCQFSMLTGFSDMSFVLWKSKNNTCLLTYMVLKSTSSLYFKDSFTLRPVFTNHARVNESFKCGPWEDELQLILSNRHKLWAEDVDWILHYPWPKWNRLIGHFELQTSRTIPPGHASRSTFQMSTQGYCVQIHNKFSKIDPWSWLLASPPFQA